MWSEADICGDKPNMTCCSGSQEKNAVIFKD